MEKLRVLFVCVHNSARSQMAEAFLKQLGGEAFEVESAGLEPGKLNPVVVEAMREIGFDISNNKTKGAFDLFRQGKTYNYVIAVCDQASSEKCPIYPGALQKLQWSFEDPSSFQGSWDEKLEKTREVRDSIKEAIENWLLTIQQKSRRGL